MGSLPLRRPLRLSRAASFASYPGRSRSARSLAFACNRARAASSRSLSAGKDGVVVLAGECTAMAFDGRFRIRETEDEAMGAVCGLPTLQAGESLTVFGAQAERQVTAPPRNTEARLVSRLEERGIGRPSTWAAILAVLQERGYAVVHEQRLVRGERKRVMTAFLEHGFGAWIDYGFTAAMEDDLDRIAAAALGGHGMLEGFWGPFDAAVSEAGGLSRKTVRAAIKARLDGFLFGQDGRNSRRRRGPACGRDSLELKFRRYGPLRRLRGIPRSRLPAQPQRRRGGKRGLSRPPRTRQRTIKCAELLRVSPREMVANHAHDPLGAA